mgnify:CR=1 FL=1
MEALHIDHVSRYRFPVQIDSYDYRTICLFTACIVYAIFGSPTPDQIGTAEVFIFVLLALAIGIGRARDAFLYHTSHSVRVRFWKSAGQVMLIYGLSFPLCLGVAYGNESRVVLRDVVPFFFLFLPLFLLPVLRARPYYFRSIVCAIMVIGMMFSLRSLVMRFIADCPIWCGDELLYLENMPTVLFTCLLLIGGAMHIIMQGVIARNVIIFYGMLALSLLPLAAMALTLQRASLGAVALYTLMICGYFFVRAPARAIAMMLMGGIAILLVGLSFSALFDPLWVKTQKVGLNMRPQEFAAVWDIMRADPMTFLFGIGWGGQFNSPAVGGLRVNFTHNFFSTILLKTGMLGVIFCIAYILGLLERLVRVILRHPVFGLALSAPILIDLSLYASFKSLDFGLVLLLISGSLVYFRQSTFNLD